MKQISSPPIYTILFGIFLCLVMLGYNLGNIYGSEPSASLLILTHIGMAWHITRWLEEDGKKHGFILGFCPGLIFFMPIIAWPFAIYYLFKSRGLLKAMVTIFCFYGVCVWALILTLIIHALFPTNRNIVNALLKM